MEVAVAEGHSILAISHLSVCTSSLDNVRLDVDHSAFSNEPGVVPSEKARSVSSFLK